VLHLDSRKMGQLAFESAFLIVSKTHWAFCHLTFVIAAVVNAPSEAAGKSWI